MIAPPRLARWLVARLVPPPLADAVLGDLHELLAAEQAGGVEGARRRYWRRALGAAWQLRARRRAPAVRGDAVMYILLKDVVHGLRLFVAQPAYAWAAVVTLALAIGANTVIFSIANVLVVKPLPFADESRLGWILVSGPNAVQDRAGVSLPEFAAYRDEVTAFARLGAWRRHTATIRAGDNAETAVLQRVVGDVVGIWGLGATIGRPLAAADEQPGAARVATISHQFWIRRFGGDPGVLGRELFVEGERHVVVGVVVPDIELGNMAELDVWVPVAADPALASRRERGWRPVGRLRPEASLADADAQVAGVAARLGRDFPDTSRDWTARVGTTRDAMGGANTWLVLTLLAVVVGLLLILACANVMNLLIARLIARRQELAVRTALGATRGRVVRQIVAESLLLGLGGGLVGLAIGAAGLRAIHAVATEPFFDQIAIDWRVVVFALGLSLLAPLAFAVLPTLKVLGADVRPALQEATTRSVGGGVRRGRATLVLLQVALAVMLLAVSSLVVRSMRALVLADPGYDPAPLVTADLHVPTWKLADDGGARALRERLVERARLVPGVAAAATMSAIPSLDFPAASTVEVVGREAVTDRDRLAAGLVVVSPDYFAVTQLPLVAGRAFTPADATAGEAPVVVSAEAARRFWGGTAAAIGRQLRLGTPGVDGTLDATVVGVVRDTLNPMVARAPDPLVLVLDAHLPTRATYLVVRATAADVPTRLRAALQEVDGDLGFRLRTVPERFADEHSSNTLLAGLFAAFALVALLLATAGLYGVVSYAVSQRTPEIAVRLALGASPGAIARDVVGGSLRLALAGAALGLAGALALAQTMTSMLFGVTATDAPTYLGAAAAAVVAAVVATWLPMRRAVAVDPIRSLRQA
ncbi:MAG: ADOP family duplicated permease [Vicinamibacterales bacterium]